MPTFSNSLRAPLTLAIVGLILMTCTVGCQFSTRTGMYRGYVGWRQFREPQLVLERSPLNDEEPSLWGPRFKTHALRWHDRDFGDPRYTYTPREGVAQTSNQTRNGRPSANMKVVEATTSEPNPAPPAGANHPVRLPPHAPIPRPWNVSNGIGPPMPPPGDAQASEETDSYPSFPYEGPVTPLPPPYSNAPMTQ